jgi:hypothetical protein
LQGHLMRPILRRRPKLVNLQRSKSHMMMYNQSFDHQQMH